MLGSLVQAWQVPHPPSAGAGARAACASRPAVHRGFWKSWAANGLNERMVARVLDLISSNNWPFTKVRRNSPGALLFRHRQCTKKAC